MNMIKVIIGLMSVAGIAYVALTSDKHTFTDVVDKFEDVFNDIPNINENAKVFIKDISTPNAFSKVVSIMSREAARASFDSTKVDTVRKIAALIKKENATNIDKSAVIDSIDSIMRTCTFDSSKKEIMRIINDII